MEVFSTKGRNRLNQLWCVRNFQKYQNQWVSLSNGELIAVADSLRELILKVPNHEGMMLTRV